jgi:hypothetical protein
MTSVSYFIARLITENVAPGDAYLGFNFMASNLI